MRKPLAIALLIVACSRKPTTLSGDTSRRGSASGALHQSDSTDVMVHGPTLVAFSPYVTQGQVDSNADLATVLDDFDYHLSTAMDSLHALGITVVERPAGAIELIEPPDRHQFVPAKDSADVGYLFVGPGRRERVYYGVMTNSDLIATAHAFLAGKDM